MFRSLVAIFKKQTTFLQKHFTFIPIAILLKGLVTRANTKTKQLKQLK
jgi:hypothetical protein